MNHGAVEGRKRPWEVRIPAHLIPEMLQEGWNFTRVCLAISDCANWRTGEAFPSYRCLREKYGIPTEQAAKGISRLVEKQWLKVRRERRRVNHYQLTFPPALPCSLHGKGRPFVGQRQDPLPDKEGTCSIKNILQENERIFLSASLRSAALKLASDSAESGIPDEEVPESVVDDVLGHLNTVPAFRLLDLSNFTPREMVNVKLDEFASSRAKAVLKGKDTTAWYLRCLRQWFKDMWDPYNDERFRWGAGAHLERETTEKINV